MIAEPLLIFLASITNFNHSEIKQTTKPKMEIKQDAPKTEQQLLRGGWDRN